MKSMMGLVVLFVFGWGYGQDHSGFATKPPGLDAIPFAPGVVSRTDRFEFGSVFNSGMDKLYYAVSRDGIAEIRVIQWRNNRWQDDRKLLGDDHFTYCDPFLSRDGQRLYFISNRPLALPGEAKDIDIWFLTRIGDGWSSPQHAGTSLNSAKGDYYISLANNGALYFASNRSAVDMDSNFDLYKADPQGSGWSQPQPLPGKVNTKAYEADVFVAPDESYLIFSTTRRSGLGRADLYISFRNPDGQWQAAKNMGAGINTAGREFCPAVTPNGRWLFFTRDEDIYWADAAIIDQLRP